MKKSLFILMAIIGMAITAEAQQFYIKNAVNTKVRIRVKSFTSCTSGIGCEATTFPGVGQIFGSGGTIINSCNPFNQFGNAGVQVWSPVASAFVSMPAVIGMCGYPFSTGVFVWGIGFVIADFIPGATPTVYIHL
jgi:hypothetical protein